jgi:hypothetical protein
LFTAAGLQNIDVVFARFDAQSDADHGEPQVVLPHHHHRLPIEGDRGQPVGCAGQPEGDDAAGYRRDARRDERFATERRHRAQQAEDRKPRKIVRHRHP